MSMRLRLWLPGLALLVGGVIAGVCHLFNFASPRDLAHVAQYAPLGAFVHLVLFIGGLLTLLGWFGYYALQHSGFGSISVIALVCLFFGILWADLMRSILEFSVFPVVDEVAPYALPGLADTTYQSMPVSFLLTAGRIFLFAGASAATLTVNGGRTVRWWPAVPFALTAALQAVAMLPHCSESIRNLAMTALYFSSTALGTALLFAARDAISPAPVDQIHNTISYEDSQPAGR